MGIARFATFSNGSYLAPLNSFKRHETTLRKAQQSLRRLDASRLRRPESGMKIEATLFADYGKRA